ncbi:MAG: hypothetical protein HW394_291 [Acidobacteria bacterium]|nr:hypothetical protein [Acidobacteriota bacterium]
MWGGWGGAQDASSDGQRFFGFLAPNVGDVDERANAFTAIANWPVALKP